MTEKMPQSLIIFCLTLLRKGDVVFGLLDLYEVYRDHGECEDPISSPSCGKGRDFTQDINEPFDKSAINLAARDYAQFSSDLVVSVPGGSVVWSKACRTNQWQFSKQWQALEFTSDSQGALESIALGDSTFESLNGSQTEFKFGDYYMASNAAGWRMEKISNNGVPQSLGGGAWRQYDAAGQLQQYGRGSNLIAGLILRSNEQPDRRRL